MLVSLLQQLISIPSVNPMGGKAEGAQYYEGDLTAFLLRFFEQRGIACECHEVVPGRANVVARLDGRVFSPLGINHQLKSQIIMGIIGHASKLTLMALLINMAKEGLRLAVSKERYLSSNMTMGKRTNKTSMDCFQAGGASPFLIKEANQPA